MESLASHAPDKLIELLSARLAHERASAEVYDAIVAALDASEDDFVQQLLPPMQEFLDHEREHAGLLAEAIARLGGDADAGSDLAALVEAELEGPLAIARAGDRDVTHLFHALLAVELGDVAGWQLLATLAEEACDEKARGQFDACLAHEQEHLDFVRSVVTVFTRQEVLGEPPTAP
jgi:bacterioferritin (cytochrome b1)